MQNKLPFISVVIPAYNEEKYLPRCLKALQNQSYLKEKFDITIVDNNSTDKTAEIAKKYGALVISEKKQGHVYSLNTGLKSAKGAILAITDADTIVSKNWLETLAKIFQDPSVVGTTGSVKLDLKSESISSFLEKMYQMFLRLNFAVNRPHTAGPNMALRKSAFKKLKEVDTRYKISGDVEIGMRLRMFGNIKFEKQLTVTTSSRRFKSNFKNILKDFYKYSSAYIYAIWLEKPPHDKLSPIR